MMKYYTCNLCLSTNSFRKKPLMALDGSLKSRKHFHRHLPKCDQDERIRRIYSSVKKYCHKDYTLKFINFNKKKLFCIIFPIVLLAL